jgi:hypothetical protein
MGAVLLLLLLLRFSCPNSYLVFRYHYVEFYILQVRARPFPSFADFDAYDALGSASSFSPIMHQRLSCVFFVAAMSFYSFEGRETV